jgi:hypothetical protein
MKSLVELWRYVADELATWCRTSTIRDAKTVAERSNNEGVSFLTITLPSFGKDFERSLDQGYVDSSSFRAFARVPDGAIPAFLQGMTSQVFDRKTGRLVEDPEIDCIYAVRQLTLMFSKILIDCTDARKRAALEGYLNCEQEVRENDSKTSMEALNELSAMSFLLFGNLFATVERELVSGQLWPKHGPGSTADRLRGNAKYDLSEWPVRLNHSFPWEDYGVPNSRYLPDFWSSDERERPCVDFLEPGSERPVKVVLVPKTLKTPRIIAEEPTAMQYAQQALFASFRDYLESPGLASLFFRDDRNVSYGMIGFEDQEPNRRMAKRGSSDGSLATLDLSEASDRVSNLHVMALFSRFPNLLIGVQDCRSTKADVPGHGVIHLAKFASMGSALTFPMEAMVFLTVVFLGIQDALSRRLTREDILSYREQVRVYGDDIIVPVDFVQSVIDRLNLYGYKVNHAKSFWTGRFRESCGKEFFAGADVSIQRVRMEFPTSRLDAQEIVSLVSLRNRLWEAGFRSTVEWLDKRVWKLLPHYPLVHPTSPVLGRWSERYEIQRFNQKTHGPEVKGYVVSPTPPVSPISGQGALMKFLLYRGLEPLDKKHLERQGRPHAVDIKLRWCPPY